MVDEQDGGVWGREQEEVVFNGSGFFGDLEDRHTRVDENGC